MANDMLRYGIKEVADVRFYEVSDVVSYAEGKLTLVEGAKEVLALDSLKVSNMEFTAEQSDARGGKGNAPLIIWDYGREVNVTLEDALVSFEMLQVLFGSVATGNSIVIGANTFPGTYAVIGKTFARDTDGKDHLFTFYIGKAKVQSENTLTMEAEGDPSVFNISLRVLRDDDGNLVTLTLDENVGAETTNFKNDNTWVGESVAPICEIEFVYANGEVKTYRLAKGATLDAPDNTTGMKWSPDVVTEVIANAVYTEVANA